MIIPHEIISKYNQTGGDKFLMNNLDTSLRIQLILVLVFCFMSMAEKSNATVLTDAPSKADINSITDFYGQFYTNYLTDFNCDNKVSLIDLILFARDYGKNITLPPIIDPDIPLTGIPDKNIIDENNYTPSEKGSSISIGVIGIDLFPDTTSPIIITIRGDTETSTSHLVLTEDIQP